MENNFWQSKVFKNMVYITGGLLIVFLVFAGVLKAREIYNSFRFPITPYKTLVMTGQGKAKILPDIAYVNFNFSAEAKDLEEFEIKKNASTTPFILFLKTLGIQEENIIFTPASTYAYATPPKFSESLTIKVASKNNLEDQIKKILEQAKKEKIFDTNTPDKTQLICLGYENPPQSFKPAWEEAIKDAQNKATDLAKLAGQKIGNIVSVSDLNYNYASQYNLSNGYAQTCNGQILSVDGSVKMQEVYSGINATFEVK